MRYVALAALVVLVGGYVVGQQPATESKPTGEESADQFYTVGPGFERGTTDPIKAAASSLAKALAESKAPEVGPVGRYVPFGNDRLLDTTNGTLFRINGDEWVQVVEMRYLSYEMVDEMQKAGLLKDGAK
jgi:hypothetical protein